MWQKSYAPFCNEGDTEQSQPTREDCKVLLIYSRSALSPLEKPQDGVCDGDYQDGIKHNMGVVCTPTVPCASRERGGAV